MKRLSCAEARQIDLVEYLAALGYKPQKIRNEDYWYHSPLRREHTPSFKVNQKGNIWFDFGTGQGGDLIDFGVAFFRCSVSRLLELLSEYAWVSGVFFHPPISPGVPSANVGSGPPAEEKKEVQRGKILLVNERPLGAPHLLQYLQKRCIPPELAQNFLREVEFMLYGKKFRALGFANDKGGFELRNEHFKGSSSPKAPTFMDRGGDELTVFEGFFDFLSFQVLYGNDPGSRTNFLVLNSLAFFKGAKDLMDGHRAVHLYLDRDLQGREYTRQACTWDRHKYRDQSTTVGYTKDLNEWLVQRSALASQLITRRTRRSATKGKRI